MGSPLMWWTCCEWWIKPGGALLDNTLSAIILLWYGHSIFLIANRSLEHLQCWFHVILPSIYCFFSSLFPPFCFYCWTVIGFAILLFFFLQLWLFSCSLLFELHSINIVVLSNCGQWNFSAVSNQSLNITELIFWPLSEEVFSIFSQKTLIF